MPPHLDGKTDRDASKDTIGGMRAGKCRTKPQPSRKIARPAYQSGVSTRSDRDSHSVLRTKAIRKAVQTGWIRKIEPLDKSIDEPDGIVSPDIIVNRFRQKQKLRTFEPRGFCEVRGPIDRLGEERTSLKPD